MKHIRGVRKTAGVVSMLALSGVLLTGADVAEAKGDGRPAADTNSAGVIQAEKVAPLTAVASALGEQGRGAYADVYGNLYVDEDGGSVTLYATDTERGRKLIDAAKAAHSDINVGLVKVVISKFSKRELDALLDKIMPTGGTSSATGVAIYSASINPDASGITVTGDKRQLAAIRSEVAADAGASSGISVTVAAGSRPAAA